MILISPTNNAHASYRVTGNAVAMGESAGKVAAKAALASQLPLEVKFINRARIVTVEFEEIMPGYVFRVFGRNLFFAGQKPSLTFFDPKSNQSFSAEIVQADPYVHFAKDIVVMKNRMDVDGNPIADRNVGETILSQGGNPVGQTVGKVTDATSTSISDKNTKWPKFGTNETNQKGEVNASVPSFSNVVAIVSGKGTGQWRYITGNTDNSMQIDRLWDVTPEKGSQYVVMKWSAEDWLVKDNVLEGNNRGIWFYCGGNDVVIEGNKLTDSEGIYLRTDQRMEAGRFNLIWNFLVENNHVSRALGKRPAYICSVLAIQKTHSLPGTGTIGVEIRRNLVQTKKPNATSFVPGEGYWNEVRSQTPEALGNITGILGTIFEKNTAVNSDFGYRLSKSTGQTVIKDPVCVDVPALTNESLFPESTKIGTVHVFEKDSIREMNAEKTN